MIGKTIELTCDFCGDKECYSFPRTVGKKKCGWVMLQRIPEVPREDSDASGVGATACPQCQYNWFPDRQVVGACLSEGKVSDIANMKIFFGVGGS